MADAFERWFTAGWGQMDSNAHLANTAYLDMAADTRMMFFAEHGFAMDEFVRQKFGPVVRRDELEYFREVRLLGLEQRKPIAPPAPLAAVLRALPRSADYGDIVM